MKSYCVTACGTDIGKTFITSMLCQYLVEQNKKVNAIKPVISGWTIENNDTKKILESLNRSYTQKSIESTSPWRLLHPLAPNMAAKLENTTLNYQEIQQFCHNKMQEHYDYLFIEGAGGLMSPIDNHHTWFDLIRDLAIKVILVVGSYLGSISHALTAITALKDTQIQTIIVNQNHNSSNNIAETAQFISSYSHQEVIIMPTINAERDAIPIVQEIVKKIL